jgi:hypothetical protein
MSADCTRSNIALIYVSVTDDMQTQALIKVCVGQCNLGPSASQLDVGPTVQVWPSMLALYA